MTSDRRVELEEICRTIRRTILEMVHGAGSGHMGGSLSCVEILVTLYLEKMRFDPRNPLDPERDRFVLSKGHAAPALYALFAYLGLLPREELRTLRRLGSRLQGHPDMKSMPGIEMSSGPLGLGLSAGLGMALAARLDRRSYLTYVLLGDGELQEGMVWEAAMAAAGYQVGNLVAVVDRNHVQLDGTEEEVMPLGDLAMKFTGFGWEVRRCNGHSLTELEQVLTVERKIHGRPVVVIAETVKGKGVSFMEGRSEWHGKPVDDRSYEQAVLELGGRSLC